MVRYIARIPSRWDADRAFAYMADFSNAAEWDPGVRTAVRARAAGVAAGAATDPAPGATFDLVVRAAGRDLPLRYEITRLVGRRVTLRAETPRFISEDTVTVTPDGDGSVVEYEALLTLRGAARVFSPLMAVAFRRIGERARRSLAGLLAA